MVQFFDLGTCTLPVLRPEITVMFCVLSFGSGSGPIIFSEVTCDESDSHILHCGIVGYSSLASSCSHSDDVGIICCKSFPLVYVHIHI